MTTRKIGDSAFRVIYDPESGKFKLDYWVIIRAVLTHWEQRVMFSNDEDKIVTTYYTQPASNNKNSPMNPLHIDSNDYPTHAHHLFNSETEAAEYLKKMNPQYDHIMNPKEIRQKISDELPELLARHRDRMA